MTTYYKATRPDGTSFHDGKTRWEVGEVTTLPDGSPLPYLSVSVEPADCTGMSWPCQLFEVEPAGGHEVFVPDARFLPNKRGATAWRVVRELDPHVALGPNGVEVAAIIERARSLTANELDALAAAWDAARYAAWDAAWDAAWYAARDAAWDAARYAARDAARYAAWDAAWDAARYAARDAARDAAWDAAWDAALATLTRDLITPEQYDTLMGPWREVVR